MKRSRTLLRLQPQSRSMIGHPSETSAVPKCVIGSTALLDDFVGKQQYRRGHRHSDRARGLEVRDQSEASRSFDGQVRDNSTAHDLADQNSRLNEKTLELRP